MNILFRKYHSNIRTSGFSLIELMVVIFIVGFAFTLSYPFLNQAFRDRQANSAGREIYTDFYTARISSIRDRLPYRVEFCENPPGYIIMRCPDDGDSTPDSGDFTTGPCDGITINVCTELGNDLPSNNAAVVREVNLSGERIIFGFVGSPGKTPYGFSDPPIYDIDLEDCDPGIRLVFYFNWRGQVIKNAAGYNDPCRGVIYLTGRMNEDEDGNRAYEFTTVGTGRIYRYDSVDSQWE